MATYHVATELGNLALHPFVPSVGIVVLSLCGLDHPILIGIIELLVILLVFIDEKDDLFRIPISGTSIRFLTAGLTVLATTWAMTELRAAFQIDNMKDLYRSTDTWGTWGVTAVVQYLELVNFLACFRTAIFGVFLFVSLFVIVYNYFYPNP